jgi:ABC-type branched-subunit amino acid transport system ATPase component
MLVEHVMRVLMKVSERVLIMHQGRNLFEGTPQDVQAHPEVIRVYLGSAGASGSAQQGKPDA